jgi:hypothetical protein
MAAGVMAGFGLWGSMFPIDTIKSKIQADSLSKPQFKGTIDCMRRFLAVEGTRQLIADTEESVDALVSQLGSQQASL